MKFILLINVKMTTIYVVVILTNLLPGYLIKFHDLNPKIPLVLAFFDIYVQFKLHAQLS